MSSLSEFLLALIWYGFLILFPGLVFSLLVHYLLSLPMNRRDRALFFLDLVETVVRQGQSVEQAIVSAAENKDPAMGPRYFLIAAHIENGAKLSGALEKVPSFLPPQVNAMLQAGEKQGDLKKVLPACREVLRLAPDTVRTTMHYMVAILLLFAPIAIFMISLISTFVIPRFREVAAGIGAPVWSLTEFVFHHVDWLVAFESLVFIGLMMVAIVYIGGPGFVSCFRCNAVPIIDWLEWRIPWKRKKLQRIFSAMLAVLLDGGMPEGDAVRLAGDCTANEICRRRAQQIISALQQGERLQSAIDAFDDTGEFQWRLANAAHGQGGFLKALNGWLEALEAKAFQQEETATHTLTSGLVIMNGVIVALIATAVFGILIAILNGALVAS
ncbi:MAG TPA: type II secretion system F family protein [Verrucomicrobiae bacterium]|jgi:type II secretory pathway component PulF